MIEVTNEVIIERLDNLKESNMAEHAAIKLQLEHITDDHESRIKALEYWKIAFVAKFTAYAGLGVFVGTLLAQILVKYFVK
jgi:hypothetical protein